MAAFVPIEENDGVSGVETAMPPRSSCTGAARRWSGGDVRRMLRDDWHAGRIG